MNDENKRPESDENRIRRGYSEEVGSEEASADRPNTEPAEGSVGEGSEYRYKSEPIGGQNFYFDKTKTNDGGSDAHAEEPSAAAGGYRQYGYRTSQTGAGARRDSEDEAKAAQRNGTIATVLGSIGLVLFFFCCGGFFVSLILGIVGIIFASKSVIPASGRYSGQGKVGMVLSIITLVLGSLSFLLILLVIIVETVGVVSDDSILLEKEVYIQAIDSIKNLL